MSFATFTITPNGTPTGGTYLLAGNSFSPTDTPTLSGWTLTSGTTYAAGPLVFTCDTAGHQTQPTFDDSGVTTAWDGSLDASSGFSDGIDPTAATQQLFVSSSGTNGPPATGTWTVGDWTGDISATPAPTGWSADTSLSLIASGGSITLTRTSNGSGQTPLTWDTSTIIGNDSNPWDGTVGQSSFTDGIDGTAATDSVVLLSAGTGIPSGGTWALDNSGPQPLSAPAAPSAWSVTAGYSLTQIYSGLTWTAVYGIIGAGRSAIIPDVSLVTMAVPAASLSFVDGSGPFLAAWARRVPVQSVLSG